MSTRSISKERHRFGPTQRDVPVIGQGTWYIESGDRAAAIAALRLGLDLGMTHVDTAEMYGSGEVEEIVGEAIAGRRDAVFLVSKVLPEHASRSGTITACEASLARLGTDRLDCYLLHWRGAYPLEETFAGGPRASGDRRGAQGDAAPGGAGFPGAATVALHHPKASTPEHAAENAGAGELRLSDAELARIDEAFPRGPRPWRLPML